MGLSLLILAIGGLELSWAVTDPIGAAPDEPANYIKALAAGEGDFLGSKLSKSEEISFRDDVVPTQRAWLKIDPIIPKLTRRFSIPPRLQPNGAGCTAASPVPAVCVDSPTGGTWGKGSTAYSYLGTYQPFVYVLPGLVMRSAADPEQAFLLGRLTLAFIALLLIGTAVWLVLSVGCGLAGLLGVLVSLSPMVLFAVASLSSSSTEIAGGVAVSGAVIHLAYKGRLPRLAWSAFGVGSVFLVCSRTLGPLWMVMAILLGIGLVGWRSALVIVRRSMNWFASAAVLVLFGVGAGFSWQMQFSPVHP